IVLSYFESTLCFVIYYWNQCYENHTALHRIIARGRVVLSSRSWKKGGERKGEKTFPVGFLFRVFNRVTCGVLRVRLLISTSPIRSALSELRLNNLAVGADGRNRTILSGLVRIIPYWLHLWVDRAVGLVFVIAPFAFKFAGLDAWYYWVLAAGVLLSTSVFNAPEKPVATRSGLDMRTAG